MLGHDVRDMHSTPGAFILTHGQVIERYDEDFPLLSVGCCGETVTTETAAASSVLGRWTRGVAPCAVQAAGTVRNGGEEETDRKVTRLVPTPTPLPAAAETRRSASQAQLIKERIYGGDLVATQG